MCARYTISDGLYEKLERYYGEYPDGILRKTGDIRPTEEAPVIMARDGKPGYEVMHWGFPGFNGKGILINARAETVEEKKTFQHGIRFNRCVIPASGFYEWDAAKDKVMFSRETDELLLFAGFFDRFDENRRFIIITTEANESVRGVHDRMPLLVSYERLEEWLLTDQFRKMLTETMPPLEAYREYDQLSFAL